MNIKNWTVVGLFNSATFLIASMLYLLSLYFFPKVVIREFDRTLALIKLVGSYMPEWWGDVLEVGMRLANIERTFLFLEVVALVKLVLLALGYIFRRDQKKERARYA